MAKYVRCIDDFEVGHCISIGTVYEIIGEDFFNWKIGSDDNKNTNYFSKQRFEKPYEVQEPIVFLTQQDFEDAVMKTVMQRLSVFEWREGWKTHFGMEDSDEDG